MKNFWKPLVCLGGFFGGMVFGTLPSAQAALINVALGQSASQSTTNGSYVAGLAVDGILTNFTHTAGTATDPNPWWKVDLGGSYAIQSITLENRHDCCRPRLQDTRVQILGMDGTTVVWDSGVLYPGPITDNNAIPLTTALNLVALTGGPVQGNWVRVQRTGGNPPGGSEHDRYVLSLAEVQVFSNLVLTGKTAPGGFVRLGANSEMLYHLDAGKGVTKNESNQVSQWDDQSGRGNNFAQTDSNRQPLYQTSGFGGKPALRFDGDNSDPDGAEGELKAGAYSDTLLLNTSTAPRTVFLVNSTFVHRNLDGIWGLNNADIGIRRWSANEWRQGSNADAGDFTYTYIDQQGNVIYQGSMYVNGAAGGSVGLNTPHILTAVTTRDLTFLATNIGNYFVYGHPQGSRAWNGDLAEVLVFNRALNQAELRVVENHLSAKYGIPLASGADFYAGDDSAKGDYDLDVFGAGRVDANNTLLNAGSVGFGFQLDDASLGDGEFLMAGHKKPTNAWVSTDLPAGSGIRLRWDRVWYVDATGMMDATLAFGFTDGGVIPQTLQPAEYYALLYSPTNDFEFTVLKAGEWNGPDQIFFQMLGSQLQDGYYTLGIAVPEPASVVLLVLGAAVLVLARGFGSRRVRVQ